ncbi:MAG: RDD family protein [Chitinophagales bacterium]
MTSNNIALDQLNFDTQNVLLSYSGFWVRFVACLMDITLLYLVAACVNLSIIDAFRQVFYSTAVSPENVAQLLKANIQSVVIATLIGGLYYPVMEASAKQATIGKIVFKLKVVDLTGRQLSLGRAVGRYFAKIASGAFLFIIGFISAGFTKKKQALHDIIARTLVVKNDSFSSLNIT